MNDHVTHVAAAGQHTDAPLAGMDREAPALSGPEKPRRWGRHLLMMAMCLPMLLVVGALVATGVAGRGVIVYAVLCTAMMAAMMMLMPRRRH